MVRRRFALHFSNHFHPAYHVGMLECAVLHRHGHSSVDDERGTNPELGAEGGRKTMLHLAAADR